MQNGYSEFAKFVDIDGPSNLPEIMSVIGMQGMVSHTHFRHA